MIQRGLIGAVQGKRRFVVGRPRRQGMTQRAGAPGVGVRVVNTKLGNIPSRQYNTINVRTPGTSRPETFYFKT